MFKELLLALALLGPASAIALFIAWRWRFFRYRDLPNADISGGHLIWAIVIFFVGQIVIPVLSRSLIVALLMPIVTIPALWLLWRPKRPKPKKPWRDFFLGIASWAVAAPTSALLGLAISLVLLALGITITERQAPIEFFAELAQDPILLPIAIISLVILVPILEELIFRGFIQSWLRRHLPRQPALALSALGFSLMHYAASQGAGNLVILPAIFVIGYFLGHLYERQGSLSAPIGLHITYNALGIFNELLIG